MGWGFTAGFCNTEKRAYLGSETTEILSIFCLPTYLNGSSLYMKRGALSRGDKGRLSRSSFMQPRAASAPQLCASTSLIVKYSRLSISPVVRGHSYETANSSPPAIP
jgi:hypothetical protein